MSKPTLFDRIVQAALDQGIKSRELADGHMLFTNEKGVTFKTRRSGVERARGKGHAVEEVITRLRRIGLVWPVPPPQAVMYPSVAHANAKPHLISPVPLWGKDSVKVNIDTGMRVSEETAGEEVTVNTQAASNRQRIKAGTTAGRGHNATRLEIEALAARLAKLPAYSRSIHAISPTMAIAEAAGCSASLVSMIRNDSTISNVSSLMYQKIVKAMDAWDRGEVTVPLRSDLTDNQKTLIELIADNQPVTPAELWNRTNGAGVSASRAGLTSMMAVLKAKGYVVATSNGVYSVHPTEEEEAVVSSPEQDVPAEPEAAAATVPSERQLSAAAITFAELFEQELQQRVADVVSRNERLEAEIAQLRSELADANARGDMTDRERERLREQAMTAAEEAVRAVLKR